MTSGLDASFEKRFPGGPLIHPRNLTTRSDGGITVLFGASGSGKSTILRCIAGLEKPGGGFVRFADEMWSDAEAGLFLPSRRRRVGLVPQDHALFPHLTIAGNVGYGLLGMSASERRTRVGDLLEWLGLDGLQQRLPRELSGGQQQRVALARALAPRPRLLLLDEPLSSLDQPTRLRLRRELRGWLRETGVPALLVTHDRLEAAALGDEIIVLHDGRIIQQGPVREVFSKPASPDVADILAVETILPGRVDSLEAGIATVRVDGVLLMALAGDLPPGTNQVIVCIRAEDVSLSVSEVQGSSPRNRLPAVVTDHHHEGPLVRIVLDCGFALTALLTPQGFEELGLAIGSRVTAVIKAPKIHLIAR